MTSKETAQKIAKLFSDKHGEFVKIVDISEMTDIADFFVLCTGKSVPQVKALFNYLEEEMEKIGQFARRKEGVTEGRWIAVDYTNVIVHIFHKDTREIYALDTLWNKGDNVTLVE